MDYLKDLLIPMIFSGGFSLFLYKTLTNSDSVSSSRPERITGDLSLNIFKGNNTVNVNINASSTPSELSRLVFSVSELETNSAIFVFNGRRLNNQLSLGEQSVRTGSFIHSQLNNGSTMENQEENTHNHITLIICVFLLISAWVAYFCYPNYFSFVSRTILIGFSELLGLFVYYQIKPSG